ncbi:hypothetical protein SprV_0301184600 [Sparganum proliferum]
MNCGGSKSAQKDPDHYKCHVFTCGCPKRRLPILGTEDPDECKSERAFTIQAQQTVWDIGKPPTVVKHQPLQDTRFKRKFLENRYPFHVNHSGTVSETKIAWQNEIDKSPIEELLPDAIEGLADKHPFYSSIAHMVIVDIIKHAPPEKVIAALPRFALAFKKTALLNNEDVARRLIKTVKEIALVQETIGPELAFYFQDILLHLNQWILTPRNNSDRIAYEQKKKPQLADVLEELLTILTLVAGNERDFGARGMKLAIPTYQLPNQNRL